MLIHFREMMLEDCASYLKAQLDPEKYKLVPPNVNNQATTIQEYTVLHSFMAAPGMDRGVYVWNVQASCTDVHFYRNVAAGTVFGAGCITGVTLTVTADMVVPVAPAEDVKIDPAPESTRNASEFMRNGNTKLNRGRLIAGKLSLWSASTSTTTAALSGVVSGGSLNDTRQVQAFRPADIATQSTQKKDSIISAPIKDGIVALLGPEVGTKYVPVSRTSNLLSPSGYPIGTIDTQKDGAIFPEIDGGFGPGSPAVLRFYSPYLTATGAVQNIVVPKLGLQEVPSFAVYIAPTSASTASTLNASFLFARMDSGVLTAFSVSEAYVVKGTAPPNIGGTCFSGMIKKTFHVSAVPANSMWVGFVLESQQHATPADGVVARVDMIATGQYEDGGLGPVRVLQFSNVATGQQVILEGKLQAQTLVSGDLTPFLTNNLMEQATDTDMIPISSALFNGPNSTFRRVWQGREYNEMKKNLAFVTGDWLATQPELRMCRTLRHHNHNQDNRKRQRMMVQEQ